MVCGPAGSHVNLQIVIGTLVPLALLAVNQVWRLAEGVRRAMYVTASGLTLIGIFAMRWNVVIGGQLFSKSFLGYTTYKLGFVSREGLLPAIGLMLLPFVIFFGLVNLLPPWSEPEAKCGRACATSFATLAALGTASGVAAGLAVMPRGSAQRSRDRRLGAPESQAES
jgi:hypothetical protein